MTSQLPLRCCKRLGGLFVPPCCSDPQAEAEYLSSQADKVVSASVWCCAFATCILTCGLLEMHCPTLDGASFELVEMALPMAMLCFTLYFGARRCLRSKLACGLDEWLAFIAGLLLSIGIIMLSPLRAMPPDRCRQDLAGDWMATPLSQIIGLLIILWIPLSSKSVALLMLASLTLVYWSEGLGASLGLLCLALLPLYAGAYRREQLSRLAFTSMWEQQELAMKLKHKESEAKSNMTLARAFQSLAGRRCDLVLVLDANLAVWRPTPLQDMFFKEDMQTVRFPEVLEAAEQEIFYSMVKRVRQHKFVEAMPLTLPQGRSKILLEYAGCEEDRFVVSILLDDPAEAFEKDDNARLIAGTSWMMDCPAIKVSRGPLEDEEDSLQYSASEVPNSEHRSSKNGLYSDSASGTASAKRFVQCRDAEVQVEEKELAPLRGGKPPLPPGMRRRDSNSSLSSRSSSPRRSLREGRPGLRLTSTLYTPTSRTCIDTSLGWLLLHWNFHYAASYCCPWHAATCLASKMLRAQSKEPCNPLWSPFTGWQCGLCSAMNHASSEHCDLCATTRPEERRSDSQCTSQDLDGKMEGFQWKEQL